MQYVCKTICGIFLSHFLPLLLAIASVGNKKSAGRKSGTLLEFVSLSPEFRDRVVVSMS